MRAEETLPEKARRLYSHHNISLDGDHVGRYVLQQEYSLQLRQIMKELTASLVVLPTNSSLNRDLSNTCLCLLKEQKDD